MIRKAKGSTVTIDNWFAGHLRFRISSMKVQVDFKHESSKRKENMKRLHISNAGESYSK